MVAEIKIRSQLRDGLSQARDIVAEICGILDTKCPWFGTVAAVLHSASVPNYGTLIICHAMHFLDANERAGSGPVSGAETHISQRRSRGWPETSPRMTIDGSRT